MDTSKEIKQPSNKDAKTRKILNLSKPEHGSYRPDKTLPIAIPGTHRKETEFGSTSNTSSPRNDNDTDTSNTSSSLNKIEPQNGSSSTTLFGSFRHSFHKVRDYFTSGEAQDKGSPTNTSSQDTLKSSSSDGTTKKLEVPDNNPTNETKDTPAEMEILQIKHFEATKEVLEEKIFSKGVQSIPDNILKAYVISAKIETSRLANSDGYQNRQNPKRLVESIENTIALAEKESQLRDSQTPKILSEKLPRQSGSADTIVVHSTDEGIALDPNFRISFESKQMSELLENLGNLHEDYSNTKRDLQSAALYSKEKVLYAINRIKVIDHMSTLYGEKKQDSLKGAWESLRKLDERFLQGTNKYNEATKNYNQPEGKSTESSS